jgi:exodeoxyribonuclease-3
VTFRLLTYNIWLGGEGRAERIARVIAAAKPDLVLLQEATRPAIVEAIAVASGMGEWRAYEQQSLGYLSRLPVSHAAWHKPRFSHHAFVEIVPAGQPCRVFGVHLSAVHSAWTERRRLFELRALLRTVQQHEQGFHLLAGDFNTLAPGATLDRSKLPLRLRPLLWVTAGRVRWRTVKTVLEAGYVDAYRTLHPESPGYTMPTWDPHVRLDYAFVPSTQAHRILDCNVVTHADAAAASDHLPVYVDIRVD